jgi:hypothetical protein
MVQFLSSQTEASSRIPGLLIEEAEISDTCAGPNTGRRTMPVPEQSKAKRVPIAEPLRTTRDCYKAFPVEVKASCPLLVSQSPDINTIVESLAAGPLGGKRHRPPPVERPASSTERKAEDIERNQQWLSARRGLGSMSSL